MKSTTKNALIAAFVVTTIITFWKSCNSHSTELQKIAGETMATTWQVSYFDDEHRDFKKPIDSILVLVNKGINTYDSTSEVSVFNKSKKSLRFVSPHFPQLIKISQQIFTLSHGAFDPTVMPLVNHWGFGPDKHVVPDSSRIDSLMAFIGFDKIESNNDSIWKSDSRVQLDFGGIGQGYGADVITNFLKSKGIKNMLVELGGEGMACGINLETNKNWTLGIANPDSEPGNPSLMATVSLKDRSYTTAGSYANYRVVNGIKYSHTINPKTGFPVDDELLSISVFAKDAATADAWDTALMVMGKDHAIALLKQHPDIDAFLIYSTTKGLATFATEGIASSITINP